MQLASVLEIRPNGLSQLNLEINKRRLRVLSERNISRVNYRKLAKLQIFKPLIT